MISSNIVVLLHDFSEIGQHIPYGNPQFDCQQNSPGRYFSHHIEDVLPKSFLILYDISNRSVTFGIFPPFRQHDLYRTKIHSDWVGWMWFNFADSSTSCTLISRRALARLIIWLLLLSFTNRRISANFMFNADPTFACPRAISFLSKILRPITQDSNRVISAKIYQWYRILSQGQFGYIWEVQFFLAFGIGYRNSAYQNFDIEHEAGSGVGPQKRESS